jgi:hypothetical protein
MKLIINTPSQCGISNSFPIYRLFVGVDVNLAHSFMMRRRMMFCEIIRQILVARSPVHVKLALFHSVFYPIKTYIHGFCAFLFYCTIAVSCGSGIIRFHWCGGLFVPQFLQCCPNDCFLFGVYKNCPNFCFGCRRHYVFENLADDQNRSVCKFFVGFCVAAHVKEPPALLLASFSER